MGVMALQRFLDSCSNGKTSALYRRSIPRLVVDGDRFVRFARVHPEAAENFLIDRIVEMREGVSPSTLDNYVSAVKCFCEFERVALQWKLVRRSLRKVRSYGKDRPPAVEEVRRLLGVCSVRMRALVLLLLSCGMRIGALDYLHVGDFQRLPSGVGRLRIYAGEPEEYFTFCTPEACDALEAYLDFRRRAGEKLMPGSPLFRDQWDQNRMRSTAERPVALNSSWFGHHLGELWVRCGVRPRLKRGERAEIKQAHGFRKFFKTRASQVMKHLDVELIMDHSIGISNSYYCPSIELLEKEYLRAVPLLTISEVEEVRREGGEALRLKTKEIDDLRSTVYDLVKDVQRVKHQLEQDDKLSKS